MQGKQENTTYVALLMTLDFPQQNTKLAASTEKRNTPDNKEPPSYMS